jgi:hypothetical protein
MRRPNAGQMPSNRGDSVKRFKYRVSAKELTLQRPEDFANDLAAQLQHQGDQGWELCGTFEEYGCIFFLWKQEKEETDEKSNDSGDTFDKFRD